MPRGKRTLRRIREWIREHWKTVQKIEAKPGHTRALMGKIQAELVGYARLKRKKAATAYTVQHVAWTIHLALREMIDEIRNAYKQQGKTAPSDADIYDQLQKQLFPQFPSELKAVFRHQRKKE